MSQVPLETKCSGKASHIAKCNKRCTQNHRGPQGMGNSIGGEVCGLHETNRGQLSKMATEIKVCKTLTALVACMDQWLAGNKSTHQGLSKQIVLFAFVLHWRAWLPQTRRPRPSVAILPRISPYNLHHPLPSLSLLFSPSLSF